MRGKNQRVNPPSEWVVVENAHQALITEDEAEQILASRNHQRQKRFDKGYSRSRHSSYLLSGGLFTCARCGSNLLGLRKTQNSSYYICGSQPHRRGMGCGHAVYVPQNEAEREVISGLSKLLEVCSDPRGFTSKVNSELRRIWEHSNGYDPALPQKLKEIDSKIANIRKAVEEGLPDSQWAHSRMRELLSERDALAEKKLTTGQPSQIDQATAMAYRSQFGKVLEAGTNAEKKRLMRSCVEQIKLHPDTLEIEISYKIPDAIGELSGSGGALGEIAPKVLGSLLVRRYRLSKSGRKPGADSHT